MALLHDALGWHPVLEEVEASTEKARAGAEVVTYKSKLQEEEVHVAAALLGDQQGAGDGVAYSCFSRPHTPPRTRVKYPAGATDAYIIGRDALQKTLEGAAAQCIQGGIRGLAARRKVRTCQAQEASAMRLQALVRGCHGRQHVSHLCSSLWMSDDEVLLATMRWMAEKEDIHKVLLTQLDMQADYLFPDRKLRYAGPISSCLAVAENRGIVVTGGVSPKRWCRIPEDLDVAALPKAPPPRELDEQTKLCGNA